MQYINEGRDQHEVTFPLFFQVQYDCEFRVLSCTYVLEVKSQP